MTGNRYVVVGELVRVHMALPGWGQSGADRSIDIFKDFGIGMLRGDPEVDEDDGGCFIIGQPRDQEEGPVIDAAVCVGGEDDVHEVCLASDV